MTQSTVCLGDFELQVTPLATLRDIRMRGLTCLREARFAARDESWTTLPSRLEGLEAQHDRLTVTGITLVNALPAVRWNLAIIVSGAELRIVLKAAAVRRVRCLRWGFEVLLPTDIWSEVSAETPTSGKALPVPIGKAADPLPTFATRLDARSPAGDELQLIFPGSRGAFIEDQTWWQERALKAIPGDSSLEGGQLEYGANREDAVRLVVSRVASVRGEGSHESPRALYSSHPSVLSLYVTHDVAAAQLPQRQIAAAYPSWITGALLSFDPSKRIQGWLVRLEASDDEDRLIADLERSKGFGTLPRRLHVAGSLTTDINLDRLRSRFGREVELVFSTTASAGAMQRLEDTVAAARKWDSISFGAAVHIHSLGPEALGDVIRGLPETIQSARRLHSRFGVVPVSLFRSGLPSPPSGRIDCPEADEELHLAIWAITSIVTATLERLPYLSVSPVQQTGAVSRLIVDLVSTLSLPAGTGYTVGQSRRAAWLSTGHRIWLATLEEGTFALPDTGSWSMRVSSSGGSVKQLRSCRVFEAQAYSLVQAIRD
jgi:hypothetical protein